MQKFLLSVIACIVVFNISCSSPQANSSKIKYRKITVAEYVDKMKAGWLGQLAGVATGGPAEFAGVGKIVPDDKIRVWTPDSVNRFWEDDLYTEMTFIRTLELHGMNVSYKQAGIDFANTGFGLCHANFAGRDNLRHGIAPPDSGHPKFNKHADDIDYQIEADFSGLLAPGLPNTAIKLGEKFGSIMNYGDGLYAGQFIGGMYSEAFFENDPEKIVQAGLKCIPQQNQYAECVRDVLAWHQQNPDDWQKTWQFIQDKYLNNRKYRQGSCNTKGKFEFDIDAKINGAYVVMGLLYGNRDIYDTMATSIRCGQDGDCNPSNSAGVLFTTIGFNAVPEKYKSGLNMKQKFFCTDYNFPDLIKVCEKLARETVIQAGGRIEKNEQGEEVFVIPIYQPVPSKFVQTWQPGPIANSRYTKKEMEKITGATEDLSPDLDKVAPGWKLSNCGNGEKGMTSRYYEERNGKKNIILTHPLNRYTPCVFSRTVTIPVDKKTVLKLTLSNHPQYPGLQARGEWYLIVKANDKELLNQKIDDSVTKKDWMEINVDLSDYAGKTTTLEVINKADENWGINTASWAGIEIISQ